MATTLHCLAYNTHLFLGTVPGKFGQEYDDEIRLNHIIAQVKNLNPDLVGFSEVWANSSKDRFISGLQSQLPYSAWDENTEKTQMGSGLLLLSRFPLSHTFTKYEKLVSWDGASQKGFLIATVEIEAQKLLIAHTHTQADYHGVDSCKEIRKSNILQLQSGISKAADISTPVILLGDINIIGEDKSGDRTSEYDFLCDTLKSINMKDSYRTLNDSATSAPGYTYDAVNNKLIARFAEKDAKHKVQQRLDYIFVRGITPISVTVPNSFTFQPPDGTGTNDLSDHYPLDEKFSIL